MAKVVYDREKCIGAAACIAAADKFFKMGNDGKADLIGSKKNDDGKFELEVDNEDDIKSLKEAAEACPVSVIVVD